MRHWKHGDAEYKKRIVATTKVAADQCIVDGCINLKRKGSYCRPCESRKYRYGSPKGGPIKQKSAVETAGYTSWQQARLRVLNTDCKDYPRYGGRGISIDPLWVESFWNFHKDMGDRPAGTSLDRIDNNGDYNATNCRWATPVMQSNNRRDIKKYMFNGQEVTIRDVVEITGTSYGLIKNRLNRGWSITDAALTLPGNKASID